MKEKLKIIVPPIVEEGAHKPKSFSYQRECIKCGQCCRTASPTLLKEDYSLFLEGILNETNTYTLRAGEPILNRQEQDIYILPFEVIKIDEENMACYFYEGSGECSIYESRPIQCRVFECWNTKPNQEGLETTRLTREDIFGDIESIINIIKKHDEICSYEKLFELIQRLKDGDESSIPLIQEMIDNDITTREFLNERFGISPRGLHLVLGKPIYRTINLWGLEVLEKDGSLILSPIKEVGNEDIS